MNDDTINRQDAIDAIERLILPQVKGETAAEEINRVAWRCAINCAEEMIVHLPSAERRGRWIDLKCNQCGQVDMSKPNYCPNCGARMEAEE